MNSLQIKDKLDNDKTLKDTEIYNLYFELTNFDIDSDEIIKNPVLIFNPLNELDKKYEDFNNFILPSAQLLGVKRNELFTFLAELAEMYVEEKLKSFARRHLLIIKESDTYSVYYPTNNREDVVKKIFSPNSDYSRMILSEEYSHVSEEWYEMFKWTLE